MGNCTGKIHTVIPVRGFFVFAPRVLFVRCVFSVFLFCVFFVSL